MPPVRIAIFAAVFGTFVSLFDAFVRNDFNIAFTVIATAITTTVWAFLVSRRNARN